MSASPSRRGDRPGTDESRSSKRRATPAATADTIEEGDSEDGTDLEFEDLAGDDDLPEEIIDEEESDSDDEARIEGVKMGGEQAKQVFRPGVDQVMEDEKLQAEPGTYRMLHSCQTEWPCLSFDTLPDSLGASRTGFPMTAYVVGGTQADVPGNNKIVVMKWHKLARTGKDGDQSDSSSSDEDEDDAVMDFKIIKHKGGINRDGKNQAQVG